MSVPEDLLEPGEGTNPPLDDGIVSRAEETLGVRLPRGYLEALRRRNGGYLTRRCYPTDFPSSWAPDHIGLRELLGLGGEDGADALSAYLVEEWEYPDIGVVLCHLPSGGHDIVMLDYSASGPQGEPAVAYVDEDRVPRRIADSFDAFAAGLVDCGPYGTAGAT